MSGDTKKSAFPLPSEIADFPGAGGWREIEKPAPRRPGLNLLDVSPDLRGGLDDECELGDLVVDRDLVAVDGA